MEASFGVVYTFRVLPEKANEFESAWRELTLLIRKYEGGLGSRLHKVSDTEYFAYAQWPNKQTWESSGDNMPASAQSHRDTMRAACTEIKTLVQGEIRSDELLI